MTTAAEPGATVGGTGGTARSPQPRADAEPRPRPALPHVGALDGLRGLAVLGVLAFHTGADRFRGGFLGVSLFFTLSGFLITTLLVREAARDGRPDLRRFWVRRARRLLPAAVAAIALAVVLVGAVGDDVARDRLPAEATASVAYVANWQAVAADASYAELFRDPSPLAHMWSLAVEEQAYVVLPLIALAAAAIGARRAHHRRLAVAIAVLGLGSLALGATGLLAGDRAYYGTDARFVELAVGALLACALARRPFDDPVASPRSRHVLAVAGPLALVGVVVSWLVVERTDPLVARGGLAVHALAVGVVIVAALVPRSPLGRTLSWRPLAAVGLISYGLYLYHWPVFWWLDEPRTGIDGIALTALRLTVTAALAITSYRFLEQPVRRGARPRAVRAPTVALGAVAAVVVLAVAVPVVDPPSPTALTLDQAPGALMDSGGFRSTPDDALLPLAPSPSSSGAAGTAIGATASPPAVDLGAGFDASAVPMPSRPVRILVLGDSTAWYLSLGLMRWGEASQMAEVAGRARIGCGLLRTERRTHLGQVVPTDHACNAWPVEWPAEVATLDPDLVVVASGWWEAVDAVVQHGPDDEVRALGDPVFDDAVRADYALAADLAHTSGAPVVWLDDPPIDGDPDEPGRWGNAVSDPGRVARLNAIIDEVAAERPWMTVLPYAELYETWPGGWDDPSLRPDGVHVDGEEAWANVTAWLGPRLVGAWWLAAGTGSSPTVAEAGAETAAGAQLGTGRPGPGVSGP